MSDYKYFLYKTAYYRWFTYNLQTNTVTIISSETLKKKFQGNIQQPLNNVIFTAILPSMVKMTVWFGRNLLSRTSPCYTWTPVNRVSHKIRLWMVIHFGTSFQFTKTKLFRGLIENNAYARTCRFLEYVLNANKFS